MIENLKKVSNPLTIIAIFAGIAEVSGSVVLPFISESNQQTFMWFVMLFPTLLVILFFSTLFLKHTVLYAPSDYKDEKNFISLSNRKNIEYAQMSATSINETVNDLKEDLISTGTVIINDESFNGLAQNFAKNMDNELALHARIRIIAFLKEKRVATYKEIEDHLLKNGIQYNSEGFIVAFIELHKLAKEGKVNNPFIFGFNEDGEKEWTIGQSSKFKIIGNISDI